MRLFALFFLVVAACEADVEVSTWSRLDMESYVENMENPTGVFERAPVAAMMSNDPPLVIDTVRSMGRSLGVVLESIQPTEGEQPPEVPTPEGSMAEGSSIFVKLSCPGPDQSTRVTDFSAGQVRIDVPAELSLKAMDLDIAGDILIGQEACESGELVFDGRSRAFYEAQQGLIALDNDVHVTRAGDETVLLSFNPLFSYRRRYIDVLLRDEDRGSIRLTISGESAEIILTDANRSRTCTMVGGGLSCL